MLKNITMILGSMFISLSVNAELTTDLEIKYTGMYGDGKVYIAFQNEIHNTSGCTWVVIRNDHPYRKEYQSLALTALAASRKVDVSSTACVNGSSVIEKNNSAHYLTIK